MSNSRPVAAIDCGTNSTRLLILSASGEVLERCMEITRLGQGVDADRRLDPVAVERTLKVLRAYRERMEDHRVERTRAAATSAVRDASNAEELLSAAADVIGVRPEILDGSEEGSLSFAGATASLPEGMDPEEPVLVADIGGGSTEIVIGPPARPDTARAVSLDIGCVRLTERFFGHDPPGRAEMASACSYVQLELRRARQLLPEVPAGGLVVGLAGTVSTLAALALGLDRYDRDRIHHSVLSRADVDNWSTCLACEDSSARARRPGMIKGREDVILGGVVVLAEVMAVFDRAECLVSESDILDGLAASICYRSSGTMTSDARATKALDEP